jgi:predicted secreted Zn-dependent protease
LCTREQSKRTVNSLRSSVNGRYLGSFAVLFAIAAGASGQIHRCERDGDIAYSDQPCGAGAKSTQQRYAAPAPNGALDFDVKVVHYEVFGSDFPSLMRSLRANGPQGFHGLAQWKIGYQYTTEQHQQNCSISSVRVRVSGAILMPRWVDASNASAELQRRWTEYYAALQKHEDGHIQHGRELAILVRQRLMGLGAVACDRLQALAQREYDRLYGNLKTRDREYDARTNHGVTQGALFRPL